MRKQLVKADVAIIGAGPVGLFAVFELGLLGLNAIVFDSLDKPGGQCSELYPQKPIYDIPAWPVITGQQLTDRLIEQIAPFEAKMHLGEQVEDIAKQSDGTWQIATSEGFVAQVSAIFIAAGAGSFTPRKPKVANLSVFEDKSVFYSVKDSSFFNDKGLVIVGGGDSALDWTLSLLEIAGTITLVHRRHKFRASPASLALVEQAINQGRMNFVLGELAELIGENGQLDHVVIKSADGQTTKLNTDYVIALFGLNTELGPLVNWGLDIREDKLITVDTEKFQTNVAGIFAIGDINWYPGKLKLILSGFHEAALAARAAFEIARPDERFIFRYTTSSTQLQKRLRVA